MRYMRWSYPDLMSAPDWYRDHIAAMAEREANAAKGASGRHGN